MVKSKFPLRSVKYFVESEAQLTAGLPLTGSQSFTTLRFNDASFEKQEDQLKNELAVQYVHQYRPNIVGRKRAKLSLKAHMYGATTALSTNATPAAHDWATIGGVMLGGIETYAGSGVPSNSSASGSFSVDSGHGSARFPNGYVYGAYISGALECNLVLSKSTDVIIPHFAHSALLASGTQIYGSHNVYLASQTTGSLQLDLQGDLAADHFVGLGCLGTFGIETTLGQVPMMSIDLMGTKWVTGSAETLAEQTYPNVIPPVFKDSKVYIWTVVSGATAPTPTNLAFKAVSFKPTVTIADVETAGGSENISAKVLTRTPDNILTFDIQTYLDDVSYYTARTNATEFGVMVQVGSQPGQTVCLVFPRCQITNVVHSDLSSLLGQTLSFRVLDDNQTNKQSQSNTDICRSPFRIAYL